MGSQENPQSWPSGRGGNASQPDLQHQLELRPQEILCFVAREFAQADLIAGGAVGEIGYIERELGVVALDVAVHADGDFVEEVLAAAVGEGDIVLELDEV